MNRMPRHLMEHPEDVSIVRLPAGDEPDFAWAGPPFSSLIRTAEEMEQALKQISELRERASRVAVEGHRQYNPGWHLALDLRNMLLVSECIARAALERTESRGGHTRNDYPATDDEWGNINLHCVLDGDTVTVERRPLPQMPDELRELFQ